MIRGWNHISIIKIHEVLNNNVSISFEVRDMSVNFHTFEKVTSRSKLRRKGEFSFKTQTCSSQAKNICTCQKSALGVVF